METASPARLAIDRRAQDVLFREARTAHTFADEPVGDDHIREIHQLVKWAPTSFNQQPLRVVLVRSSHARQRLVACMGDSNQAKTRTAPLTAILAADTHFHQHLPTQYPVWPGLKDMLFTDAGVREQEARLNGALQVAYFILGVRAAGLAAGPMTGFDPTAVDREFFPDGHHRSLVVVNIGRPGPDAFRERLPRLAYEQVFSIA